MVMNLPVDAGDAGDMGLILGSERASGGGKGNPVQCVCLENPMDREAWRLQSMGSQKSRTRLSH